MIYEECLKGLSQSINQKGNNELFLNSLNRLKAFGKSVSTKYLRSLVEYGDNRQKTKRISYLLSVNGLKTKRQNRYFRATENYLKKVEINTYQDKGFTLMSGVLKHYVIAGKPEIVKTDFTNVLREKIVNKQEVLFFIKI